MRGSFPRTPHDMANSFWNQGLEKRNRPKVAGRVAILMHETGD